MLSGILVVALRVEGEKRKNLTFDVTGTETRRQYARRRAMRLVRPLPLAKNETNRALLIGTSRLAKLRTFSWISWS